jgi:hypothetical protein
MTTPEGEGRRGSEGRRRLHLLGVVAYVLVPGERRRRATGHFRRAGLEAAMGIGELARPRPGEAPEREGPSRRERIEIE